MFIRTHFGRDSPNATLNNPEFFDLHVFLCQTACARMGLWSQFSSLRWTSIRKNHHQPFAEFLFFRSSNVDLTMADADCIFCKIIAGKIPCFKIYETEKTLSFMDIGPLSKGHCLVIPKQHGAKLHELSEETMADVGPVLLKVAKAIGAEDYNILQNNGKLAHQEVPHVHFHIIPKTKREDGLAVGWQMLEGDAKPSMEEIGELANQVKARIA